MKFHSESNKMCSPKFDGPLIFAIILIKNPYNILTKINYQRNIKHIFLSYMIVFSFLITFFHDAVKINKIFR